MNPRQTVLLLGGTTLLGKLIGMQLTEVGYRLHTVGQIDSATQRSLGYPCEHFDWDGRCPIPDSALDGVSIVVNVAGTDEPTGAWQRARRGAIHKARLAATRSAVEAIQRRSDSITTFVQASSLDYYGDVSGDVSGNVSADVSGSASSTAQGPQVDETAAQGHGYWAQSVGAWEDAAAQVPATTRLAILRFAPVYSYYGGILADKAKFYSFNMGNPGVDKNHWRGWLHETDCMRLVQAVIEDDRWTGPINATAPIPTTEAEIHRLFSSYYGTMARIPVVGGFMKWLLGYDGVRDNGNVAAVPDKALRLEFTFACDNIADCLAHFLDRKNSNCMFITLNQWVPMPREQVWGYFKDSANWNGLNPASHQLRTKPGTPRYAQEGEVFSFDLSLYRCFSSSWSMRHINRVRPKTCQYIMQEGIFEVWEQTLTFTDVAGGTRIDEVMRYRWPLGSLVQVLGYFFAMPTYAMIFAHRQKVLAKDLGRCELIARMPRAS